MSRKISLLYAAALFALSFISMVTSEAGTAVKAAHVDMQPRCDTCHDGKVKVAQMAEAAPPHCYQCHDQQQIAGKLLKLALADAPEITARQTPVSAAIGMR